MANFRGIRLVFTFAFFFYVAWGQAFVSAEQPKVRVAFPQLGEFSYVRDGVYGGYIFDYLQEISHYTGWEYEYVTVEGDTNEQLSELLQMLEDGRIDLMGCMLYTDATAQMFDFPEFSSGSRYTALFVRNSNTQFDDMNYSTFDGMRVGALKKEGKVRQNMWNFFKNYEVAPHVIEYTDSKSLTRALRGGEVDAVLSTDFRTEEGERLLARFNGEPYYFVTTKGNKRILNGLNSSLAKLRDANPNFSNVLYKKHFHLSTAFHFYLTEQEKAYVRQSRPIRVIASPDWAPLQNLDRETGQIQGVTKDILDAVATQSGLRFEIVPAKNYAESLEKLAAGEADLLVGAVGGERLAAKYGFILSTTVMPLQMVTVRNKGADLSKQRQILALPRGQLYSEDYLEDDIRYYDNIEQCIEAVNNGDADLCYGSTLSVMYYTRNQFYDNIALVGSSRDSESLQIAFAKPVQVELLTIVNKAILSLPTENLQQFVDANTVLNDRKISWRAFIRGNPTFMVTVIFFISVIVISAVTLNARNHMRHNRKAALDNKRYRLLSELSNEYIYEYDYADDVLGISDRLVRLCDCPSTIEGFLIRQEQNPKDSLLGADFAASLFKEDTTSEFRLALANREIWVRNCCSTILDKQCRPVRRIGKLLDITAEKLEKEGLLKKAQYDSLTGIYNKGATEGLVAEYLQSCSPKEMSILIIFDVDNFKNVNDSYGHLFGDTVLRGVAEILRNGCRSDDIAGRVGGDEFVVLLKNVNGAEFLQRIERLEKMLHIVYSEQSYTVCVSMGVALVAGGEVYLEAIRRADLALYRAKRLGKNQYCLYTPDLEELEKS